jgi:hypothetical protein
MIEKRNTHTLMVGKSERNGTLGRPRHRCMDNIKNYFGERGWDSMDWIGLAQGRDKCSAT